MDIAMVVSYSEGTSQRPARGAREPSARLPLRRRCRVLLLRRRLWFSARQWLHRLLLREHGVTLLVERDRPRHGGIRILWVRGLCLVGRCLDAGSGIWVRLLVVLRVVRRPVVQQRRRL